MIKITEIPHENCLVPPKKYHFSSYISDKFPKQLTQIAIHRIVDSFLRPKLFPVTYYISLQVFLMYQVTDNRLVLRI